MLRVSETMITRRRERRGSIIVLAAAMMVVLAAFLAFAIDMGYLVSTRTELQRSADAAVLAAAWELIDEGAPSGAPLSAEAISNTRSRAVEYAALNAVGGYSPTVDINASNDANGDVVIGYLASFTDLNASMDYSDPTQYNAIRVRVQRSNAQNGQIPLFFASIFGVDGGDVQAEAYAGVMSNIIGFRPPADGRSLSILPLAMDEYTWNEMLAGNADDDYSWDEGTQTISPGSDGIPEMNLYPGDTGAAGNRGTIDIGGSDNSTADITRQITDGISPEDLEHHGGEIKFDENGEIQLNGDTGIPAGAKNALMSIIGEPRIVPLFREVVSPGNNATYTLVKWVGIRIVKVHMTGQGNNQQIMIQPANVVEDGTIFDAGFGASSDYVYARPMLIR